MNNEITLRAIVRNRDDQIIDIFEQRQGFSFIKNFYLTIHFRKAIVKAALNGDTVLIERVEK